MYIHIVKYYSALKNNEIMPLAATWMEPEISILRKLGRERQTLCDITCMCHLKNETNELIPRDLPNPGIEPRSPALQADSLLSEPPGKLGRC